MEADKPAKPESTYDFNRFCKEAAEFRKIIQNKNNSLSYMDRAFGFLFLIANRIESQYDDKVQSAWKMICEDWQRRRMLMELHGHPIGEI